MSEAFLQAVQENTRRYYWTGRITTTKGATYEFSATYEFGADDIVKGSGYISSQCCGTSEIELGTVYAAEMGWIDEKDHAYILANIVAIGTELNWDEAEVLAAVEELERF